MGNIFNKTEDENILDTLLSKSELKLCESIKFDIEKKVWLSVSVSKNDTVLKNSISFITYNVWFEPHNWDNRIRELHNLFQTYNPDFICLQEVTKDFLNFLLVQEFIQNNYYISGELKNSYDVMILSKHPVKFYSLPFASSMGRRLLMTELSILTKDNFETKIIIGNSHFESLNSTHIRKQQLETSFRILNNFKGAFLMGDFNFDSSWENEEKNIDKKYNDIWKVYKDINNLQDSDGYTMAESKSFPAWRPDRILIKDTLNSFNLEKFEIIGKNKIEINQIQNFRKISTPSDHYGLYANLSF
jgi:tyrosyl-DNA phosphodiesterase 2